jgi:hypothetical protein
MISKGSGEGKKGRKTICKGGRCIDTLGKGIMEGEQGNEDIEVHFSHKDPQISIEKDRGKKNVEMMLLWTWSHKT